MKQGPSCHAIIKLDFGEGKIQANFDPSLKEWQLKKKEIENTQSDTHSLAPESLHDIDPNQLHVLAQKQAELTKQLIVFKDIKQRLEIQSMANKVVVAEGIKDLHEQMEILLDRRVEINEIGPELLTINRESLNLTLNLSQIEAMTGEEQKEMESRISKRMSSL